MKTAKKILSVVLALVIGLGCFALTTSAETSEHLTKIPEGYVGIYTIEDLYCIRNNLTSNYILMNDIDLTEATAESGDWSYSSRGWNPIGSDDFYSNQTFSGIFDGNGYMIKGMNINIASTVPSDTDILYLGLFASISGTVRNLTISGSVSSTKSLTTCIGGIAAYCTSTAVFENCTNLVNIYCYNTSPIYVGGIVGFNNGNIYRCRNLGKIEISGSYSTTSESGKSYYGNSFAAGIAGKTSYANSIISQCINAGEIIAVSRGGYKYQTTGGYYLNPQVYTYYYYADVHASGITSGGNGSVVNCYNIADISATLQEGKTYAHLNAAGISYDCQVSNCYNVANSTGYSVGKSAVKSYCPEGSGQLATGVIELTEGQMKLKSMYSNWDFDSVWTMDGRKDYFYPELRDVRLLITKEDINHKHKYETQIITPATHTSEGVRIYTCDCGDSYVADYVDKYGHKYESAVTTPATHTKEGVMTYTCICGDSYTETIAKLEGHTYTSAVTKEPTHLEEGIRTYTCECKDSYTETIDKIADHSYNAVITNPTCEDKGYTTYTCECGDSYISNYKGATGHDYDSGIVTTKPTCTKTGIRTFTCGNCGGTYTEEVDSLGHSHTSEITTPATHIKEGVETFTCVCGDSYTKPIAKIETHNHKATVTAPTCTEKGYTTYTCECGDTYVADYVDKNGHKHESAITTPATHTSTGVMTFTCSCGDTYTEVINKIADHNHKAVITEPTCTEKGYTTYTCECGDTYVADYVGATGHSEGNGEGNCINCDEHICDHDCHKSGFSGFIWKIICFFSKIFGLNEFCECGAAHY